MEWSNQSKYNSFNSWKGLNYSANYKLIVDWMSGLSGYLPPPIEVNLDPYAECQLSCSFCITQRYLKHHREEVGEMRKLPREYIIKLIDFLAGWGVRGVCLSGGGEPTLHSDIGEVLTHAKNKGMDVALVTNAVHMTPQLAKDICYSCRWVALSVDSADRETYKKIKGADMFDKVTENIRNLVEWRKETNSKVDLCFKFLILPENQYQIYDACLLAKSLGVQDWHCRPCDYEREDIKGHKKLELDIPAIYKQFEECHKEETESFHVYTVVHKFNPEFHIYHGFNKCLAAPLVLPILTDGNAYLCVDQKMKSDFKIGSCFPNPEQILKWWGSKEHREFIKSIVPSRDCQLRCTWSPYQQQIEQVILQDKMCLSFP